MRTAALRSNGGGFDFGECASPATLVENDDQDATSSVSGTTILGQYFTPDAAWLVTGFEIHGTHAPEPDTEDDASYRMSLYSLDINDEPDTELAFVVVAASELEQSGTADWNVFTFSSPVLLEASTRYCVLMEETSDPSVNESFSVGRDTDMTFPDHWIFSTDGGTSWTTDGTTTALRFRIKGCT